LPKTPPQRWAIVGGGMLGLTLALRLRQAGQHVTVFEAAPEWGGLASAWRLGDVVWDRFYHVTLLSDSRLRAVLGELGLADELEWTTTKTGFFTDGKLHSFSTSLDFLRFPPLNLIDKARLAATIIHASRIEDGRPLEKIPVVDWLTKWSGKKVVEKIWKPLLRCKLGNEFEEASAAFIWATIRRMYAARRSGLKREMFGCVRGGYARVLDAFVAKLQADGVVMQAAAPVRSVDDSDGRPRLNFFDGTTQRFDRVVVTAAAPLAAKLCQQLTREERRSLEAISYRGIVCASLLLKRPLSPYYVTNVTESWTPFTGVIEMTALVDPKHFGGKTLVYLPKYIPADDPLFAASDAEIREKFLTGLRRMHPDLAEDDILAFQVAKVKHVFAVATKDYLDHLPPLVTSQPGLYLANSAHIVNGTLNVNETVTLAEKAAGMFLADMPKVATPELAETTA
jgi:protoporphyrinogen oxidase